MKLHLGCWHRVIPGWVHVDECNMPHIDFKTNIGKLNMFEDATADIIYVSHAFEYFDSQEANNVLMEWNRILKPGGKLRLAVPDFDKLVSVYSLTGDIGSILGPLYGKMNIKTENGPIKQSEANVVFSP